MVEHFYVALGLHVQCFVHRRAGYEYRYISVQHIHLFCASVTIVRAVQILDTLMMIHPARKAVQMMPTSRILFSKCLMTIYLYFSC